MARELYMDGYTHCSRKAAAHHILLTLSLSLGFQLCCRAQLAEPALAAVKAAADSGNVAAQDTLADDFLRHRNFVQAELWFRKAASHGYAHSQEKLGELLLGHAGLTDSLKPQVAAAISLEGIKWLTLAANQNDPLAQAELASAYLNGQLLKADLLEAYKWGDLASEAPATAPGSAAGRAIRDAAAQKMSYDDIAKAKERVVEFKTHIPFRHEPPDPAWVSSIKLTGVSGPANAPLAIINNQTFGVGDTGQLNIAGKSVQVHCLEIHDKFVLVRIEGLDHVKQLRLAN
ncbi:MAG TPA: hypothetical protein VGY98_09965 [Verrucomicrobiae bacterium]|nr:hypothetical protein [Verrucomicrobiae bacterium]